MTLSGVIASARAELDRWDRTELSIAVHLGRLLEALREPTGDDILALLRANPEAALDAVPRLRIAGPWTAEDGGETWLRRVRFDGTRVRAALAPYFGHSLGERLALVGERRDGWFDASHSGPYPSHTVARAAADERLRAEGWMLMVDTKESL